MLRMGPLHAARVAMNLLLLDIGNTRLKWALWDGALQAAAPQPHGDQPVELFRQRQWPAVGQVWISCVPRLRDEAQWRAAVRERCGLDPAIVRAQAGWRGLRSAYPQPEKLGVDRWLGMVAAWAEARTPFCVLGAGTALTFDRVHGDGRHAGGLIAPGFGSMQKALLNVTVTASGTHAHVHDDRLGHDSESAIRQGAWFAARGVIENALRATPAAEPAERRILTGGDAEQLLALLPPGWSHRPHLVLEGLLALATDGS
jgi:type III pantothenate kinase